MPVELGVNTAGRLTLRMLAYVMLYFERVDMTHDRVCVCVSAE